MTPPIPLDEAQRILLDGYTLLGSEHVALANAAGRTLAEPVIASHGQPLSNISAMDGFAVRSADIASGVRLKLIGEAPAGAPFAGTVGQGQCVKIATGGCVPDGADRVIMQEHVDLDGEQVVIRDERGPLFVRPAGMDFAAGQRLIEAGTRLSPAAIGLAAAAGRAELVVARLPRVAIIAAGDELREPGEALVKGATYNSGAYALGALVEAWGGSALRRSILPDDRDQLMSAIRNLGADVDVFVPLGGASVGARDLFREAFGAVGASEKFWRIAVVPGKPSWHARMGDGRAVLGLPGNPSSSFVCAHLLLKPLLYALTGRDPAAALELSRARLAGPLDANGPREAWLRATVTSDRDGTNVATVASRQDSGLQLPLLEANALVRCAAGANPAEQGTIVEFLHLGPA